MLPILMMLAAFGRPPRTSAVPAPAPAAQTTVARWVELQSATLSARVRVIRTSAGVVTSRDLQHSDQARLRVKADAAGRYALVVGAATGETFTSNWLNTGIGIGDSQRRYSVKQLYASVSPVAGLEGQFGGILPVRGESTEITHYDNDGYLEGGRVSVRRPKELFLDEITVTAAFLGDVTTPNVFKRLHRMGETNFHEVLASKRIGAALTASGSLTSVSGVRTLRGAVTVRSKSLGPIDLLRVETYRRTTSDTGGYALYAEHRFGPRATLGGGWANIDPHYGGLNADRFNVGRRLFVIGAVPLMKSLTAQFYAAHAVHNAFAVSNDVRIESILVWDVKTAFATLMHSPSK